MSDKLVQVTGSAGHTVGDSADIATPEQRFGIHALTMAEGARTLPSGH